MIIKTLFVNAVAKARNKKKCYFGLLSRIDDTCQFEGGNSIGRNTVLHGCKLGYGTYLGNDVIFTNVKIGKYSCIGESVRCVAGRHPTDTFASIHPAFYSLSKQSGFTYVTEQKFDEFRYADTEKRISIIIGNDVWIGSGASILEGITIGDGAIIAGGAIVTHDVPPYAIVAGVPAIVIKYRFDSDTIQELCELKWWNKSNSWIIKNAELFSNVDSLLNCNEE